MFVLAVRRFLTEPAWQGDEDTRKRLSGPARGFARKTLGKMDRKADRLHSLLAPGIADARHTLRIHLKRFCYSTEFFAPLLGHPKRVKNMVKSLSRLQDGLGAQNDAVTLGQFLGDRSARRSRAIRAAEEAFVAHDLALAHDREANVRADWQALDEIKRAW